MTPPARRDAATVAARLEAEFGLPPSAAAEYAAVLCPPPAPTDRFVERLRKCQ